MAGAILPLADLLASALVLVRIRSSLQLIWRAVLPHLLLRGKLMWRTAPSAVAQVTGAWKALAGAAGLARCLAYSAFNGALVRGLLAPLYELI